MISISPGKIPSWSSSHPVIWVESIGCPKLGAWPHGGSACPANDFTSPNLNNRSRGIVITCYKHNGITVLNMVYNYNYSLHLFLVITWYIMVQYRG